MGPSKLNASEPQEPPAGPVPQMLDVPESPGYRRIAYHRLSAARAGRPGLVWLGGFRSSMAGTKAAALAAYAAADGLACLRFDYSGQGASGGRFEDGTISRWLADACAAIRCLTHGPQILVGSSMGAWIGLLAARQFAAVGEGARVAGAVLLAPAVDFTEDLLWQTMPPAARTALARDGLWLRPSPYGTPDPITYNLIVDGRNHLLLGDTVRTGAPVHIIHGLRDDIVPWAHAVRLVERLADDPAVVTLVKDGDHRLSRPEDLARMTAAVSALVGRFGT